MVHIVVCTQWRESVHTTRVFHTEWKRIFFSCPAIFSPATVRPTFSIVACFASLFFLGRHIIWLRFFSLSIFIFGWFSVRVLFLSTNGKNVLKRRLLLFFVHRDGFSSCVRLCLSRFFFARHLTHFFFYLCVQIYNFVLPLQAPYNNNRRNPSFALCQHLGNLRIIFPMCFFHHHSL